MPRSLNNEEILELIMEAPRTGHIATVRDDGRPHVATIWLTVDGGDIVFVTASKSVKARNLHHKAYAAIAIDDDRPPFSHVTLEGPVSMLTDMHEVRNWARTIAGRYMGDDWAKAFSEMEAFPDDLVCRMKPVRMSGLVNMAEA